MECVNQMTKNSTYDSQYFFFNQNTLFVKKITQNTLFYGIYTRKENMILGRLKMGEHQAKYGALSPGHLTGFAIFSSLKRGSEGTNTMTNTTKKYNSCLSLTNTLALQYFHLHVIHPIKDILQFRTYISLRENCFAKKTSTKHHYA